MEVTENSFFIVVQSIDVPPEHTHLDPAHCLDTSEIVTRVEPSALEGLVRDFISSPYFSLQGYRLLIGPSWRREKLGRSFPMFPPGKRHLYRSLLFQLLF